MSQDDLRVSLRKNKNILEEFINEYVTQSDPEDIRKAEDYNHFSVIQLLITAEQFSQMLDLLYEEFVPTTHVSINVST